MLIGWTDILDGEIVNAAWAVAQMAAKPRVSRRGAANLDTAAWGDTERLIKDVLDGITADPEMPELSADDEGELRWILRRHEVQGALQALLAVRLTDAPETDAERARDAVRLALTGAAQTASQGAQGTLPNPSLVAAPLAGTPGDRTSPIAVSSAVPGNGRGERGERPSRWQALSADPAMMRGARRLSWYFDDKICGLVGSLEGRVGFEGLAQVRAEAYNARIVALLGAIEGQLGALAAPAWGAEEEAEFVRRYRRQAQQRHGFLTPPDFDRRRRVSVDAIYVATGIREEGSPGVGIRAGGWGELSPGTSYVQAGGRGQNSLASSHVVASTGGENSPDRAGAPSAGGADQAHQHPASGADRAGQTLAADPDQVRRPLVAGNESLTVWDLAGLVDRTVLLGDPGGGKTTAANVLTDRFAGDETQRIPFLVTLREYAAKAPIEWSVAEFIEQGLVGLYQTPAPEGLVERLLLTGRAVVVFDGLDELLDTSRRRDVSDRVEQFCSAYPLTPVLVTSRVVGYDQARLDDAQFTCYRLGGFGDDEVAAYAGKWFASQAGTREGLSAEEASAKAAAFLVESASVRDLRANPLLLSLMCILYRGAGSLPGDRVGIYAKCAELLLRKWDEQRDLYRKLGSDHLVEPTLRHLAWWLLTREDNRTTATERELVAETTQFLREREHETLEEAQRAAREFVEFCRGRMWVFSDAGTTASGEKLYAFTHRTFMEYFAAWNLAATADTPEDLARELGRLVKSANWHAVGEIAVKIKSEISDRGADRIFTALLDLASADQRESGEVLAFLAKCIESARPPHTTVRRLTNAILDYLFSGHKLQVWSTVEDNSTGAQPASLLLNRSGSYYPIIGAEISKRIVDMITSGDKGHRVDALQFIAELAWLSGESRAGDWAKTELSRYPAEIIAAATTDARLRKTALAASGITTRQVLAMPDGLSTLLAYMFPKFSNYGMDAWLTWLCIGDSDNDVSGRDDIQELTAVGQYLIEHPALPWARIMNIDLEDFSSVSLRDVKQCDEISGLAVAATVAILYSADQDERITSKVFDYPMPPQFREIFTRWAAGEVDLVEIIEE